MGVSGISLPAQDSMAVRQSSQDQYENYIRKQIAALQEKMESISNDEDKSDEQKTKEKQAAQEQIQNLNNALRQHQIQKRQEEAAKKQEAIKQTFKNIENEAADPGLDDSGFSDIETGVMITLSGTKEHMEGMVRLRTQLEGRQRTAETEEEKAAYQKKIDRLTRGIGQKTTTATAAISDLNKSRNNENDKKTSRPETKKEEVFWAETKPSNDSAIKTSTARSGSSQNIGNPNKPFEHAAFIIR